MADEQLSREEVLKVADLAKLHLNDSEIDFYRKRLGRVLGHFQHLNEAVGEVQCQVPQHVPKDVVGFRKDKAADFVDSALIMKNAPETDNNRFSLPAILEES